ncbi:hypothetical protein BDZ45DRAFT_137614 [Acephala macrosclerotiorum]|nr:hypothetical protein BDZ45DRAFT_137614 [Acephala macrosclerotiorum]
MVADIRARQKSTVEEEDRSFTYRRRSGSRFIANIMDKDILNASTANHNLMLRASDTPLPQLRVISQPKTDPPSDINAFITYVYDDTAGLGTTINIVDSGANPRHPELTGLTPGVDPDHRWLYSGDPLTSSIGYSANPGDYDAEDHGTCVTGVAISHGQSRQESQSRHRQDPLRLY